MLIRSLFLLSIFLFMTACTVNPVTGESQFSMVSAQQEVSLGAKQYAPSQQSQGGRYIVDPNLSAYVSNVGRKLAQLSDRPDLPYEFVVLNNSVPNAWALPGGKIAINRGLLVKIQDEAQLASVLSHEIVHAAARHGATQMTQKILLGMGSQLATMATQNTGYGELAAMGSQLGGSLFQASYGRDQELEADAYGIKYMVKAGYDPQAAVELQQIFLQMSKGSQNGGIANMFASHPPSQQRIDANRQHLANYSSKYNTRNKAAFDRAMRQVRRDQQAYDYHDQAVAAANKKQFDQANSLIQKAINSQPNEALFWVTKGQLALHANTFKTASSAFAKAQQLYPEYYMAQLGGGLSAFQLQRYDNAEKLLDDSLKILPTQTAVYYLGEIKLVKGQTAQAVQYFQEAAKGGGELGNNAQQRLQQLVPNATATN